MTETQDSGRETRLVTISGRTIVIRQLVDTQIVHLNRHSRILQKADIDIPTKLDSVDRMFTILHSMVADSNDLAFLVEQEEAGEIELKDLLAFIKVFGDDTEEKPKVRRGRPPTKRVVA
jgi:hypothetical protein